jgi:hypothetical protein
MRETGDEGRKKDGARLGGRAESSRWPMGAAELKAGLQIYRVACCCVNVLFAQSTWLGAVFKFGSILHRRIKIAPRRPAAGAAQVLLISK